MGPKGVAGQVALAGRASSETIRRGRNQQGALEPGDAAKDPSKTLDQCTHGPAAHRPEVLLDRLKGLGGSLTPELAKKMRKFDWTTDLRYETGRRDTGETRALLPTARAMYDCVEGRIP